MKLATIFVAVCSLAALVCAQSGLAAEKRLLLVHLTSYTTDESRKAIDYAKDALERGRPVVIFLTDRGVLAAALPQAETYKDQQQALTELMTRGAIVMVCPDCMKRYGVEAKNLLAGVKISSQRHS
ncbi:MAG TPA: DsrE family protein [Candidatus Binatia bacterium]|nr:DsrE family protein [Candidatus Binatia bacterium]